VTAVRRALELGVTFFDTADVCGAGPSERILGRAPAGHRDEVVIAAKVGYTFDAGHRAVIGQDTSPGYIRRACRASLLRLGTDRIDLYQLPVGDLTAAQARDVAGPPDPDPRLRLEPQRSAARSRVRRRRALHGGPARAEPAHWHRDMLAVCDAYDLASIKSQSAGHGPARRQVSRRLKADGRRPARPPGIAAR